MGPTRRLADAYTAVGGALLAAARSALHSRAALVAALGLGLNSDEKEELVDHGDAALLGSNLVDPYQQETAPLLGSIFVDQDGEEAPPLGYICVKAEGHSSDLEAGRVAGTRCSEIVEEEEEDDIAIAFLERKGARIASVPRRNGPLRSLADLIPSSPTATATTSKTLAPTTSQRARKPHQPFWKKGGMCGNISAGSPGARVPRHSAKRKHVAADAGRFPIPTTSSPARGASRAAGVRHHLAAASSGSGSSEALPPPPPPPPSGSAGSGAAPQGPQPAASGAPPPDVSFHTQPVYFLCFCLV